jgi:hypothetical protein
VLERQHERGEADERGDTHSPKARPRDWQDGGRR